jgi:hypothetical protein
MVSEFDLIGCGPPSFIAARVGLNVFPSHVRGMLKVPHFFFFFKSYIAWVLSRRIIYKNEKKPQLLN